MNPCFQTKWPNLTFIVGGPLITPLIHIFFGTLEKTGTMGILREIGEASAAALVVSFIICGVVKKRPRYLVATNCVVTFVALEILNFLPKISHMTPQEKMWLPIALLFYPVFVAPTVIGICIGMTNILSLKPNL